MSQTTTVGVQSHLKCQRDNRYCNTIASLCQARSDRGLFCTRSRDHYGNHVACGSGTPHWHSKEHNLQTWKRNSHFGIGRAS